MMKPYNIVIISCHKSIIIIIHPKISILLDKHNTVNVKDVFYISGLQIYNIT